MRASHESGSVIAYPVDHPKLDRGMPDPKRDKLFVNLGASQTRRRLKGFDDGHLCKLPSTGHSKE